MVAAFSGSATFFCCYWDNTVCNPRGLARVAFIAGHAYIIELNE